MGLAWLGKAVIKSLPLPGALRAGEKTIAIVGKCEQLATSGFLVTRRFEYNKALTNEGVHIGFHMIVATHRQIPLDLFWLRPEA
jgi:hypothetical protein